MGTVSVDAASTVPRPRRWSREEYYRMAEAGLFAKASMRALIRVNWERGNLAISRSADGSTRISYVMPLPPALAALPRR
jgi:hypothetical protein